MNEVARYTFHVNSNQRSSGTNTDLILQMKNTIALKSANGKFYMDVHSANIPFSFYQLSSDINTLQCIFTDTGGHTKIENVSLTIGNYTTITVLAELATKLIAMASISSGTYVGYTPVLNFSYSQTTARSTYSMTSPANAIIQMNFSSNNALGTFFGFTTNQLISTVLTATSTNVCVANPVNYLLIRSSNLIQSYNREYIIESDVFSDIIYRVPVGTSQNTWLQHLSNTDPIMMANNLITSINIYLTTNLTYNPIDLQGVTWAISFSIVELEQIKYTPITVGLLSNIPEPKEQPNTNQEEIDKLKKDYQDNLDKLEEYKKRLESKQLK